MGTIERNPATIKGRLLRGPDGSFKNTIKEYKRKLRKKEPPTPELLTETWQAIWQTWGEQEGFNIAVPHCDWAKEKIQSPMLDIGGDPVPTMMIYKPPQIKGKEGLTILSTMFPLGPGISKEIIIEDKYDTTGWIKVEASITSPNINTSEKDIESFFASQGRQGQRLGTYIIASFTSKLFTGRLFDRTGIYSRLIGSHNNGKVIYAYFVVYDGLVAIPGLLLTDSSSPSWGSRSEELGKT